MATFKLEDTTIYYEVKGNLESKETIVFLNGVMASTTSWNYYIQTFKKHYRILVHDFRGQLRSDKPIGPYSFKQHAKDLKDLMDSLDIKEAHLIGTSYGGEVGMRFAIDYKDAVKTLSIIDSVSEVDEKLKLLVKGWIPLASGNPYDFFWGMAPTIYGNDFLTNNKDFLEERAQAMRTIPKDYFDGQQTLYETFIQDLDLTELLHTITCPTLVVCGEDDILKERHFSKIIADHIPDSEYVILPNCGHVAIFEKPKELMSLLLGFVMKHTNL